MTAAPIVDVHRHIGPRDRLTGSSDDYDYRVAAERHLRDMDRYGISHAFLIASHSATAADADAVRRLNATVAQVAGRFPDRFVAAVGTVDPIFGARGLDEIRYGVESLGLAAMAWHTRLQGVYLDSPSIVAFVRQTAELGVPAFLHMIAESSSEAPWRLARLAGTVPQADLVVLDGFTSSDQAEWIVAAGGQLENVRYDLSLMMSGSRFVRAFVDRYGPERLLFGTDYYDDEHTRVPAALHEVHGAELAEADEARILGGNALALLGRSGVAGSAWSGRRKTEEANDRDQ
jgi:predicted TIM-barrel fold metal-dependent hydrolase